MTLVEILVCISIILLLAGLLITGLSRVKTSAQRATCGSNMRALWTGCQIYAVDHKGWLPGARLVVGPQQINGVATDYQFGWLAKTLEGYVTDEVINDPDPVNIEFAHDPAAPTRFGRVWKLYISAGNPDNGISPLLLGTRWPYSVRTNDLSMPAKTGVLNCQDDFTKKPFLYPHNGRINRLFADGHIVVIQTN